jgi:hypothetical protein
MFSNVSPINKYMDGSLARISIDNTVLTDAAVLARYNADVARCPAEAPKSSPGIVR